MRTIEYNALFRELAEQHPQLMHSEGNPDPKQNNIRFLRMTLSSDPVQRVLDLKEFYDKLKNKVKSGYFMVLQNYEAGYGDNGGGHITKELFGGFLILSICDVNDPDAQELVYDQSELIGEEVMAEAMFKINNLGDRPATRITANDITNDKVAQVALQYYGTRFDFTFRVNNPRLNFKQKKLS
ncbi:hypothetical protein GU926_08125 [Nibribacter ruber]|uniref:Uncharacterized protein n=1 Tax=Nibribacter ruber TaxID=2698458 RepID=A0A6P1P1K6_9BACT|nr:hypothetical protein [Nibribacter ruber]QHL87402.1 hypothetical protein GU926_08125 [Nibribacter ruber]